KEDHQAFIREFIFDVNGSKFRILETVPKEKTIFPPACTFAYVQAHVSLDAPLPAVTGQERDADPLLRTAGVTMRFGGLTALDNVNVDLPRGEIRAVIGPNGAGKSTFFNCLTGVLRPTSGRILFDGADITGLSPDRISQKGIARSYQIT